MPSTNSAEMKPALEDLVSQARAQLALAGQTRAAAEAALESANSSYEQARSVLTALLTLTPPEAGQTGSGAEAPEAHHPETGNSETAPVDGLAILSGLGSLLATLGAAASQGQKPAAHAQDGADKAAQAAAAVPASDMLGQLIRNLPQAAAAAGAASTISHPAAAAVLTAIAVLTKDIGKPL